ncbi:hypothetical protein VitviT2T_017534 [Vitis vinifera]|uniref:Uncharacterized protein n=1 Tax=Vitis vinifera TaxID=29760 RepID=A0ABY9CUH4_VITVI|nr:hypothetical protein VitviT2T_017534 [Vitis vinifera]
MPREGSWKPQGGSQLRSPVKIARSCKIISQPSWVSAKFRRHHFTPAEWLLKPPEACYRHWEINRGEFQFPIPSHFSFLLI